MVTDAQRAAAGAARARLERLAVSFLARPGVARGRMFSTDGLSIRGKIFAVVPHGGGLMAKVPATRADELVAAGSVERMVMHERAMREWVVMPDAATDADWVALLEDAHAYLDEITP